MLIVKSNAGYSALINGWQIAHGKTAHEAEIRALKRIEDAVRENEYRKELNALQEQRRAATEKWLKELSRKKNCRRVTVIYYDKKFATLEALRRAHENEHKNH